MNAIALNELGPPQSTVSRHIPSSKLQMKMAFCSITNETDWLINLFLLFYGFLHS